MISTHPLLAPDTTLILLFFYRHGDHRDLHSFLTRRSSDLTSTSAGSSAKTASVFIIARTKDSPTANRSTRATSAPATPSSSFGFACLCKDRTLVRPYFSCCHPERSEGPQLPVSRFFKL